MWTTRLANITLLFFDYAEVLQVAVVLVGLVFAVVRGPNDSAAAVVGDYVVRWSIYEHLDCVEKLGRFDDH